MENARKRNNNDTPEQRNEQKKAKRQKSTTENNASTQRPEPSATHRVEDNQYQGNVPGDGGW